MAFDKVLYKGFGSGALVICLDKLLGYIRYNMLRLRNPKGEYW